MSKKKSLRLRAEGEDDLAVISAALQDAAGLLGDFRYEPKARQFTLVMNRYRWEEASRGRGQRVRAALQIGSVLSAKSKHIKHNADEAVVNFLSMAFEPGEAPGGALVFTFSGGGELRLEVECIDMVLADVSEPWRAAARPDHDQGET